LCNERLPTVAHGRVPSQTPVVHFVVSTPTLTLKVRLLMFNVNSWRHQKHVRNLIFLELSASCVSSWMYESYQEMCRIKDFKIRKLWESSPIFPNANLIQLLLYKTKKLPPYIQDGTQHYRFMVKMSGFIQLLSSGANEILTLEGQNTTRADVFYAWVSIAYHLEQVLASPDVGVTDLRQNVVGIYNHRFY
jgi:hypothetical protein